MDKVIFYPKELADLYALKTLYEYVQEQEPALEIEFAGHVDSIRARTLLKGATVKVHASTGAGEKMVGVSSDLTPANYGQDNIEIDASILKNCTKPVTYEEKHELRLKHNIRTNKPVILISYTEGTKKKTLENIADALAGPHTVIFFGYDSHYIENITANKMQDVHRIPNQNGLLKEYYALADASINGHNLGLTTSPLHNFIEATEGGPLFMVPSANVNQYGYKQLVRAGAIKECTSLGDIIHQVKNYFSQYRPLEVAAARNAHISTTRKKYLPVILDHIKQMSGQNMVMRKHDLNVHVKLEEGRKITKISHPETNWSSVNYEGIGLLPTLVSYYIPGIIKANITDAARATGIAVDKTIF
jgi:hypothetical protein